MNSDEQDKAAADYFLKITGRQGRKTIEDYAKAVVHFKQGLSRHDKTLPKRLLGGGYKAKVIDYKDVTLTVHPTSALALMCLVSVVRMGYLRAKGILPKSMIRIESPRTKGLFINYYTAFELIAYAQVYRHFHSTVRYVKLDTLKEPFFKAHAVARRCLLENPQQLNVNINLKKYLEEYKDFYMRLRIFKLVQIDEMLKDQRKLIFKMDEWE